MMEVDSNKIENGIELKRISIICGRSNGIQPLRQISAIPDGYQKNRCQIWRLSINRAKSFSKYGLIIFNHIPSNGIFRTKSFVSPTDIGRKYVELCKIAARESNLSWPDNPYGSNSDTGYITWQIEWLERRDRFIEAMKNIVKEIDVIN